MYRKAGTAARLLTICVAHLAELARVLPVLTTPIGNVVIAWVRGRRISTRARATRSGEQDL
jgi:hypothetical protein